MQQQEGEAPVGISESTKRTLANRSAMRKRNARVASMSVNAG